MLFLWYIEDPLYILISEFTRANLNYNAFKGKVESWSQPQAACLYIIYVSYGKWRSLCRMTTRLRAMLMIRGDLISWWFFNLRTHVTTCYLIMLSRCGPGHECNTGPECGTWTGVRNRLEYGTKLSA